MQKLLITTACLASLLIAGCSSTRFPFVHRIDIQQGNVITQDMVDKLKPGMDKKQVRFVMGTPLLQDPFHGNRWDYVYTNQPGHGKPTRKHVVLYFKNNQLAKITGDLRPQPQAAGAKGSRQTTVVVPPQKHEQPGIFTRIWRGITYEGHPESGGGDTDAD
ncbi:MAG TPA: outer membrane protein assembly factor BamE [Gammaproteobacteria bacterium]|nr:outer membrane protein assembly factor BamE [Gammaproteobacteria bacterium]